MEAVGAGQREVEQHEIGEVVAREHDGLLGGAGLAGLVAVRLQARARARRERRVVLDDEDAGHAGADVGAGQRDTNVAPPPGVGS